MAAVKDEQEKMKESVKEVHEMMNQIHLDTAKAVYNSPNITNTVVDMANKLMDKMPEGKEKDKMKEETEAVLEATKEAEAEMNMKRMMKAMRGGREERRFGDGDQSRLEGREAQKLLAQWEGGMDYSPAHGSPWMRTIFFGDYRAMMAQLKDMSQAQVKQQLELRESMMNMNSVQHVVSGARFFYSDKPAMLMQAQALATIMEVKKDHVKILKKLIELGANMSAKDVAGRTALHHCFAGYGNTTTAAMAELMLQAGADPNLQDRTGMTPLLLATIVSDLQGIEMLLRHGGDPDVREFTMGVSCRSTADMFPAVQKLLAKADKVVMKEERRQLREAAGGSLATCRTCGAGGGTRCAGCFLVHYCDPACQRKDWKKHKVTCKETRAKYRPVTLESPSAVVKAETAVNLNHQSQRLTTHGATQAAAEGQFAVKVQVPMEREGAARYGNMYVYNKDRSLVGFLARTSGQEELYDKLDHDIRDHGVFKSKAFYPAIYRKDAGAKGGFRLEVNAEAMLPVETW